MIFYSSVEELVSVYAGMTISEKNQAKKVFAYLIMRDLEKEIEVSEMYKLLTQ